MEKLITILLLICVFSSCESHYEQPFIVSGIELNTNTRHAFKYEVILLKSDGKGFDLFYTNTKYSIGDTIK